MGSAWLAKHRLAAPSAQSFCGLTVSTELPVERFWCQILQLATGFVFSIYANHSHCYRLAKLVTFSI